MEQYIFLQNYWWFIISLLAGLLVFLMFVQGGNALIFRLGKTETQRSMIINATGRKWEFTFTTLVTFGGAFFASFPLFYSTSFGGAYWVWVLILLTFVFQAVAYEFQHHSTNPKIIRFFRCCLVANGLLAPFLVGAAVSTFFTGSDFSVDKSAMETLNPIISQWGNNWHGLEALADIRNWVFGIMMVFLAMTQGILYMLSCIDDAGFNSMLQKKLRCIGSIFVLFFLATATCIMLSQGFKADADGTISLEPYKYLHNLIQMPSVLAMFLIGVLAVLAGIALGIWSKTKFNRAIWFSGIGTVLVVMSLFFIAGYNGTAYYPSNTNLQSSLTIRNSCSSLFTLKTMAYVSIAIPFVLAYITYAWRSINKTPITADEMDHSQERY